MCYFCNTVKQQYKSMKKEKNVCEASNRLRELILNYFPSLKVFAEFIGMHPTYIIRLVREVDENKIRFGTIKKFEDKLGFSTEYILKGTGEAIIDKSIFNLAMQRFNLYAKENKINIATTTMVANPNTYNNAVFTNLLDNVSTSYSNEDNLSKLISNKDIIKITCFCETLEKFGIPQGSILILTKNYKKDDKVIFLYDNNIYYGTLKDNYIVVNEFNINAPIIQTEIIGKVVARIVFEKFLNMKNV